LQWTLAIPLTLPGLTLLWLVPLALAIRRAPGPRSSRAHIPVRPALATAIAGAGAATGASIILACAAKAMLPVAIRRSPAPGVFFDSVYANTVIVIAVLAEGTVAAVVVARVRQYRMPLGVLAATVTVLRRRHSAPPDASTSSDATGLHVTAGPERRPVTRVLTAATLALLPVVTIASTIVLLPGDVTVWR
jgi:hypothetical protein